MVEKFFILELQPLNFLYKINNNSDSSLSMSESNNNNNDNNYNENNKHENDEKKYSDKKYNYIKVLVDDPFNNRDIILNVTKKQKGVSSSTFNNLNPY